MIKKAIVVIALLAILIAVSETARKKSKKHWKCKKYYGCKYSLRHHMCLCKSKRDCRGNPFKFDSLKACQNSIAKLKGACKRMPCVKGKCVTDAKKPHKFYCDCIGTNSYGRRCHKTCPVLSTIPFTWISQFKFVGHWQDTPLACIMW